MGLKDSRGVSISYDNLEAIEALDRCHEMSLTFVGDPVVEMSKVLDSHPDFVMGHCFKAGMLTQAMETRIYNDMVACVERAEALAGRGGV